MGQQTRPIPLADPGLQAERTSLSWGRTALAMLVCASVLLRWSSAYPGVIFTVIVLLTVMGTVTMLLQRRAYRREAIHLANERSVPNAVGVAATTLAMCVLGGLGLYVVLAAA
ncbi:MULTISPECIES: DUF202 domain-containing protein [Corynebacterium]|uniref:DUF202 domain-containing protein n=1 Tax=Corynebacterium hadale TaxID=2026255 RepID=A0A269PBG0_9CORY|nr:MULTISPECIES: DUF202 domain-containing protein [Corynebacterium]PAJ69024.1 hypothetical protein CIG21_09205 [Corynebacterium hadale]WJZ14170.1 hypothetical protein CGOTT_11385 [Corynebacterium gottingense]WKC61245.1 hypothetical protein CHAD_12050 [Corynebacterium hadale]